MAVTHVLKNWFVQLDQVWAWISSQILPAFKIGPGEKQVVLDWVANYVTQPPSDFADSWRDGILLCELADKFSPELFHGVGILDPKNCFYNVSLALEIIKGSFEIDPDVTPENIVTCVPEAEDKLFNLLLKLKEKVESSKAEDVVSLKENNSTDDDDESSDSTENDCFAQGTGLVIGFIGRKASFIVFSNSSSSDLDLVIEIKGPSETHCCERITERSPKRKTALPQSGTPRPRLSHCGRSQSQTEIRAVEGISKKDPKMIPLEYEIKDDLISVGYIPLKTGQHTITVLWDGRYVTGSPFVAVIEDSFDNRGNRNVPLRPPILRKGASQTALGAKKPSVRFKEPEEGKMKLGKVRSRRVLRYIVKIGEKDVIVEAENSEMLAPALQTLYLPDEGTTLGPRRNSWGFVGDVHSQRRLSLMRQLCVDENDGDLDRPRSSSINVPFCAEQKENISRTYTFTSDKTSKFNGDERRASNISATPGEDFIVEKTPIASKFPRLETVCEGKVQYPSSTASMSAEIDYKISSSEDEVFFKDVAASVNRSTCATNLTATKRIPSEDSEEILCETSNLNSGQERNVSKAIALVNIAKGKGEAQTSQNTLQGSDTCISIKHEMQSDSRKTEKKELVDNQIDDHSRQQKILSDNVCQMAFFNSTDMKNIDTLCDENIMGNLPPKEDIVFVASGDHKSSVETLESAAELKLEYFGNFNDHSAMVHGKTESVSDSSCLNSETRYYSAVLIDITPNRAQGKIMQEEKVFQDSIETGNEYDERKITSLSLLKCRQDHELNNNNLVSRSDDDREILVNESKATARGIVNVNNPESRNAYACVKMSISDANMTAADCHISNGATPFTTTNMKHEDEQDIAHPLHHIESDTNMNPNFLDKVQYKSFQENHDIEIMLPFPIESENVSTSSKQVDDSFFLPSHGDGFSGITPNLASTCFLNGNKRQESFVSEEEPISQIIDNRTEWERATETQECLEKFTDPNKTGGSFKCTKIRRTLSHPYLKTTRYRMKNPNSKQISYLSCKMETDLGTENIDGRESHCLSEVRRHSENSLFESTVRSNNEFRECSSFFRWPGSSSNTDKNSEKAVPYLLKNNSQGHEDIAKDETLKQKPVMGESLKFSLRSYKDKYLSAGDEELVSSNSVKAIVEDFHSRALKYPSPSPDKTNDIYLRRAFFPPLAANEDRKTVKNHISKWEKSSAMPETESFSLGFNKSSVQDKLSLYVNVHSKVVFWESAYQDPESGGEIPKEQKPPANTSSYTSKSFPAMDDVSVEVQQQQQDYAGFDSVRDSPDNAVPWDVQPHRGSSRPVTSERTEDSGISDDLLMCLKTSDHKRPTVFSRRRSLSDPCIRTCSTSPADFLSNLEENLNIISSTLDCSSNSEASSESEDANDEYIDDEIPDYAAMFLGDYISFTGLLGPERSSLRKETVTQYLQKLEDKSRHIFDPSLSRPHECRALGVGVHYGLVSMNNHFQVLTKGAGRGNLSVSIQGSGRHDVTKIIVTYVRNDVYDVIYQVLEPGYYIISVRWSDWSIPGSPFICKVTY